MKAEPRASWLQISAGFVLELPRKMSRPEAWLGIPSSLVLLIVARRGVLTATADVEGFHFAGREAQAIGAFNGLLGLFLLVVSLRRIFAKPRRL